MQEETNPVEEASPTKETKSSAEKEAVSLTDEVTDEVFEEEEEPPAKTFAGLGGLFKDEPFERLVALLIALVALLAAIIGFLESDAGARADQANRNAQRFAVQAMGRNISGATRIGYDWSDAYQTWVELDTLALSADFMGDTTAVARFETVRDQIEPLSPLLQPPYFDPAGPFSPDVAAYEADLYLIEATALAERFAAAAALDDAWDGKANLYVTQLTLLAVTLFLFGLSITVTGIVRWLFLGSGLFITAITFVWMLVTLLWPVPVLNDQAIDDYAQGAGLAHQDDQKGAIAAFNRSLLNTPDYGNALFERGNAHYALGDYAAAANDFEAAQQAGRDDINLAWNLGWMYYLMGRFDEAIQMDRKALASNPEQIGLHFNLALALLASGDIEAAKIEYNRALDTAKRQVRIAVETGAAPPESLWWYLEFGAFDLDSLHDQLTGNTHAWTEAPPANTITASKEIQETAQTLSQRIREVTVALEYTGEPPKGLVTSQVAPFRFGQEIYDAAGNFLDYEYNDIYPYGTDEVLILFEYDQMTDGQSVLWKVYHEGLEDPSLRLVELWSLGESGEAQKPLSFACSNTYIFTPGRYTVEMYVESRLMQHGTFVIEDE